MTSCPLLIPRIRSHSVFYIDSGIVLRLYPQRKSFSHLICISTALFLWSFAPYETHHTLKNITGLNWVQISRTPIWTFQMSFFSKCHVFIFAQALCERETTEGQNRKNKRGCWDEAVRRSGEKRLHGECLSRVHSCHENGVKSREVRRLRMSIAIIP